jgi:hypothetical protein
MIFLTDYGRHGDTATYETQVVIASFDDLGAQLDTLAAGGYIVTAMGRDGTGVNGAGNFIAIGTRVAFSDRRGAEFVCDSLVQTVFIGQR